MLRVVRVKVIVRGEYNKYGVWGFGVCVLGLLFILLFIVRVDLCCISRCLMYVYVVLLFVFFLMNT